MVKRKRKAMCKTGGECKYKFCIGYAIFGILMLFSFVQGIRLQWGMNYFCLVWYLLGFVFVCIMRYFKRRCGCGCDHC